MKSNLSDTLKSIFRSSQRWVELKLEYAKLTVAEKASIIVSSLIVGAICALLGLIVIVLVSFTLVDVFAGFIPMWAAYLSVAGIYLLVITLVFALRKVLIINPVSRFITKVLIDKKEEEQQ